jgi:hypothetical protein
MKLGLALFGVIAAVGIVGSLGPSLGEAVYGSWWFACLLAALVLNTGLCALTRRPGLRRGARTGLRGWSVLVIHASVLLIALAGLWAARAFTSETVEVGEGDSFAVGGKDVRLVSARVERYADGSVSDWLSTIDTGSGLAEIRVNHPATVAGTRILQAGFAREVELRIRLRDEAEDHLISLPEDYLLPVTEDRSVGLRVRIRDEARPGNVAGTAVAPAGSPPPQYLYSLESGGKLLLEAEGPEKAQVELGTTGMRVGVMGTRGHCAFILRHTPGLGFLWAGLGLLALSVCGIFLSPGKAAARHGGAAAGASTEAAVHGGTGDLE